MAIDLPHQICGRVQISKYGPRKSIPRINIMNIGVCSDDDGPNYCLLYFTFWWKKVEKMFASLNTFFFNPLNSDGSVSVSQLTMMLVITSGRHVQDHNKTRNMMVSRHWSLRHHLCQTIFLTNIIVECTKHVQTATSPHMCLSTHTSNMIFSTSTVSCIACIVYMRYN